MERGFNDKNVTLMHASGRSSQMTLRKKEKLGEGGHGNIYCVELNECPGKLFAVKEFKHDSEQSALNALHAWDLLRNARINTWQTFRLVKETNDILMTYGKSDNEYLVSATDTSESKEMILRNGGLSKIKNIFGSFKAAVRDIRNTGQNKIYLSHDAWYFLLKRKGNAMEIKRIFVGDYDRVQISDFTDETISIRIQIGNVYRLMEAFRELLVQLSVSNWAYFYGFIIELYAKKIAKSIGRKTKENNYWQVLVNQAIINQKRTDKNF